MSEKLIPLSVPSIHGNEWKYIKECLDTEWVSSAGKYVDLFENRITEYTGAKYAVALVNGTAALHIALIVSGVGYDEEVIVPTLTFISPVNTVRYIGAHPVFMDCDEYYNIDVSKTIEFIQKNTIFRNGSCYNKQSKRRIAAIIPVHVSGNAVRIEELVGVCKSRNIKIIEDASESLGTYYTSGELRGKHTGTIGDIGCYSFNGNKIITAGGGGMLVTDNPIYAEKSRYLSTQAKDDPVAYIHNEIGFNYRLTNIQAALGVAQLEKLPEYIPIKICNYKYYKDELDSMEGLHLAEPPNYANNNHWFYSLQIKKDVYGKDREELMHYLSENNVQTRPVWLLNHWQKMNNDCQTYRIEKAIELWEKTLNIPCSVNLRYEEILRVIKFVIPQC